MKPVFGRSKPFYTCSLNSLGSSINSVSAQCSFFSQSTLLFQQHYDTLGVSPDADRKLIKAQYYKLSKKYHPDVNVGDKTANSKFLRINEAYSILNNEQSRREYDWSIRHQPKNNPSNSHSNYSDYSYRSRMRRRGNNAGVYSDTTGHGRSGFNFHNQQEVKFNFREHFQRHYGEELRRAKSEVHIRDSLNYKQRQNVVRLGLLVSMTIMLGAGGHIFA